MGQASFSMTDSTVEALEAKCTREVTDVKIYCTARPTINFSSDRRCLLAALGLGL